MNFLDSDSANDFGLWASFLGIALFSGWKLHYLFDPDGGARAITAYYALIFFAASLRTVWLSLPFTSSEPLPPVRAQHGRWMEALMGEAVNVLGDIAMMGLFILLVCFWSHMHRKVEERESVEGAPILGRASLSAAGELISPAPHRSYRRGPMENFVIITAAVFLASMINFILYGVGLYNSAVLILFDAIVFCTQAIVLTIEVLVFSSRFLTILRTIAAVNEDARDLQSKRIVAVTIVSCAFLITRFSIEAWFVADNYEFWEAFDSLRVVLPEATDDKYFRVKHWSEVALLVLLLVVALAAASSTRNGSSFDAQPMFSSNRVVVKRIQHDKALIYFLQSKRYPQSRRL